MSDPVRLYVPGHFAALASLATQSIVAETLSAGVALAAERALTDPIRRSIALLPPMPPLWWILTSGTTAEARWVGLSSSALQCSAQAVNETLAVSATDVWVHALPLFHVGGLGILFRAQRSQSRVVSGVRPESQAWDPRFFADTAQRERATLSALVPTQVYDLVANGLRAPSSLRAVVIGGARLDPHLAQRARSLGWPVLASYGMTETASQVATEPIAAGRYAGAAREPLLRVLPHAHISRAADGHIQVSGGSLLTVLAYVESDGERVRVEDPCRGSERVFVTNDLGEIPAVGWLRVAGRSGDRVKILGERVDVEDLEGRVRSWFLEAGLARREFALIALPDERRGWSLSGVYQAPTADIAWVAAARAVLLARERSCELRPFERIDDWVARPELPRTALGKIRRRDLEEQVAAQATHPGRQRA